MRRRLANGHSERISEETMWTEPYRSRKEAEAAVWKLNDAVCVGFGGESWGECPG
jgi:hypothetical protein